MEYTKIHTTQALMDMAWDVQIACGHLTHVIRKTDSLTGADPRPGRKLEERLQAIERFQREAVNLGGDILRSFRDVPHPYEKPHDDSPRDPILRREYLQHGDGTKIKVRTIRASGQLEENLPPRPDLSRDGEEKLGWGNLGVMAQHTAAAILAHHTGDSAYTNLMWLSFLGDVVSTLPRRQPWQIGANQVAAWTRDHPAP